MERHGGKEGHLPLLNSALTVYCSLAQTLVYGSITSSIVRVNTLVDGCPWPMTFVQLPCGVLGVFFSPTFLLVCVCIIDQEAHTAGDVHKENSIIFQLRIYFLVFEKYTLFLKVSSAWSLVTRLI